MQDTNNTAVLGIDVSTVVGGAGVAFRAQYVGQQMLVLGDKILLTR